MRMRFLYRRFSRRCVARTSVAVTTVPSDWAKISGSAGDTPTVVARPRLPIRSPSSSCAARMSASSCTGSRVRYVSRRRRLIAPVADEPPHHRAGLLLHERLIVLLVGAGPRHLDLLCSAPWNEPATLV